MGHIGGKFTAGVLLGSHPPCATATAAFLHWLGCCPPSLRASTQSQDQGHRRRGHKPKIPGRSTA